MFKGYDLVEKRDVAVKVNKKSIFNNSDLYYERAEGVILSNLDHANIIQLYEMIDTDDIYLVLPLMCQSLYEYIYGIDYKYVKSITKSLVAQILNGVIYIHAKNYIHRDLKPENILLDQNNALKISDFGLATKINFGEKLYSKCGTRSYQAPEFFLKTGFDAKVDIWVSFLWLSGSIQAQ